MAAAAKPAAPSGRAHSYTQLFVSVGGERADGWDQSLHLAALLGPMCPCMPVKGCFLSVGVLNIPNLPITAFIPVLDLVLRIACPSLHIAVTVRSRTQTQNGVLWRAALCHIEMYSYSALTACWRSMCWAVWRRDRSRRYWQRRSLQGSAQRLRRAQQHRQRWQGPCVWLLFHWHRSHPALAHGWCALG